MMIAIVVFAVLVTYASAQPLVVGRFACTFESANLCGMISDTYTNTRSGQVEPSWNVNRGFTQSGQTEDGESPTGPSSAKNGEYYVHFEASNRPSDDLDGTLSTPVIDGRYHEQIFLSFSVSHFGTDLDRLVVSAVDANTGSTLATQVAADVENIDTSRHEWRDQILNFGRINAAFRLVFTASSDGTGGFSDWALDDVVISSTQERECLENAHCVGTGTICDVSNFVCVCSSNALRAVAGTSGRELQCSQLGCDSVTCNANAVCFETESGPSCRCQSGYQPIGSVVTGLSLVCIDTNECLFANVCPNRKICVNTVGSFNCVCPAGYTETADDCYRNGGLSDWIMQGDCSAECNGGLQNYVRTCTSPPRDLPFGADCDPTEPRFQQLPCNTEPCVLGCSRNKTCHCNSVMQYKTGEEPDVNLSTFNGISIADGDNALMHLHMYNNTYVMYTVKESACDIDRLNSSYNQLNAIVMMLKQQMGNYDAAKDYMRKVIDCNGNVEIEGNLWDVYDVLSDKCLCVAQVYRDLMMKLDLIYKEKERCMNRDWYRSFLEVFARPF